MTNFLLYNSIKIFIIILDNWDKSDPKKYPTGYHEPPNDVGANFFPALGAYSSRLANYMALDRFLIKRNNKITKIIFLHIFYLRNTSVIEQHFDWLNRSNIGVVAVSWYPPGKYFY